MKFRPLSARGKTDTSFDALHEGLPPWLLESIRAFIRPFIRSYHPTGGAHYDTDWMRALETRIHLDPPLPWDRGRVERVGAQLEERVADKNGEQGLEIVDYILHHLPETHDAYRRDEVAAEVNAILVAGGSAWEVTAVDESEGIYALTRRVVGPVVQSIEEIRPVSERAGAHLMAAWHHLAGRAPLPDQAYFQALLAVEAAMKPVITPKDADATLGKMLRAIRDAPQKFQFDLGAPIAVLPVIEAMWTTHRRHGTDDRAAPIGMSQEEADAAVHLALTLVRWFVSGGFRRA